MKIGLLIWEVVTVTVIVFGALCVLLLRSWFPGRRAKCVGTVAAVQHSAVDFGGGWLGCRGKRPILAYSSFTAYLQSDGESPLGYIESTNFQNGHATICR